MPPRSIAAVACSSVSAVTGSFGERSGSTNRRHSIGLHYTCRVSGCSRGSPGRRAADSASHADNKAAGTWLPVLLIEILREAVIGFGVSLGAKEFVLKVGLVVKPRRLLGHVSRVVFVKVDDVQTQMKRVGVGSFFAEE